MQACPICGLPGNQARRLVRATGDQISGLAGELEIATCSRCRSSWTIDPPEVDRALQPTTGAADASEDNGAWPVWDPFAASLIAAARLFTPVRHGQLVLDLAPGSGVALGLASYLLPEPRLAAVEPRRFAKESLAAHGSRLFTQPSLAAMVERFAGKVQIVLAIGQLSRIGLDDLGAELAQIHRLLTPTGALAFSVHAAGPGVPELGSTPSGNLIAFSEVGLRKLLWNSGFETALLMRVKSLGGGTAASWQEADESAGSLGGKLTALADPSWLPSATGTILKCVATRRPQLATRG